MSSIKSPTSRFQPQTKTVQQGVEPHKTTGARHTVGEQDSYEGLAPAPSLKTLTGAAAKPALQLLKDGLKEAVQPSQEDCTNGCGSERMPSNPSNSLPPAPMPKPNITNPPDDRPSFRPHPSPGTYRPDTNGGGGGGGGGGGSNCCFIFLEARYGDGTMDEVVRKFRDENMTERNRRGYYKLSEVLVPMMRRSRWVKVGVRCLMTDPLVSYGKYHYGENKIGKIFEPVKNFWLSTFDYLGGEHPFIRENGEVV